MARTIPLGQFRNIGIMAHIDAGKTTTSERILAFTEAAHETGEFPPGAATACSWRGTRINVIDTPGHVDLTAEVERSLRVLDGAVAIFCAVSGVQPQSETIWRQAERYNVPRLALVNKMDRDGADFDAVCHQMTDRLGARPVPIQMPIGSGESFCGLIDLVTLQAYEWCRQAQGTGTAADTDSNRFELHPIRIPEELAADATAARERMLAALCEIDDSLLECYLAGDLSRPAAPRDPRIIDRILDVLRRGTLALAFTPVVCGSFLRGKGVQQLLDAIVDLLPSPLDLPAIEGADPRIEILPANDSTLVRQAADNEPFSALVFKIMTDPFVGQMAFVRVFSGSLSRGDQIYNPARGRTEQVERLLQIYPGRREEIETVGAGDIAAIVGLKLADTGDTLCDVEAPIVLESMQFPQPVIQVAIEVATAAAQEKLDGALAKLSREDPTFKVRKDRKKGQTWIAGLGESHLELLVDRLRHEFEVAIVVGAPQVAYRETIVASAVSECLVADWRFKLRVTPTDEHSGVDFRNQLTDGSIPQKWFSAIRDGVQEAMDDGVLAGYPMQNIGVTLEAEPFCSLDVSASEIREAVKLAFREGCGTAGVALLEPIMKLEIRVPEINVGEVIADLNGRRGRIQGVESQGGLQVLDARVPLAEMFGFTTTLHSVSQGSGNYSMHFSHYDAVPTAASSDVVAQVAGIVGNG